MVKGNFEFPADKESIKGAIKLTTDGTDFYVPILQVGADGKTPIGETNPLFTKLAGRSSISGKKKTVTTAGTRVRLDDIPAGEVTVIALKGNTGSIFVGGSDVSSTVFGVELQANEAFTFNVNNANLIYIDASVNGEGVSYVAI